MTDNINVFYCCQLLNKLLSIKFYIKMQTIIMRSYLVIYRNHVQLTLFLIRFIHFEALCLNRMSNQNRSKKLSPAVLQDLLEFQTFKFEKGGVYWSSSLIIATLGYPLLHKSHKCGLTLLIDGGFQGSIAHATCLV